MKRIIGTAIGVCLLAGAQAIAQAPEKQAVETMTKQTGAGATLKSETQSVSGTVKEYEAGKRIKLSGPGDKSYAFDLGEKLFKAANEPKQFVRFPEGDHNNLDDYGAIERFRNFIDASKG